MTAPGANLEFEETEWFLSRIQNDGDFKEAILDYIQNFPNARTRYFRELYFYEIFYVNSIFRVIVHRDRNTINLVYAFAWPDEKIHFEEQKEYLAGEYGDTPKKRRGKK